MKSITLPTASGWAVCLNPTMPGAARDAGTGRRAADRAGRHPVEGVADVAAEPPDLPGAGIVEHEVAVDELGRGVLIGAAAGAGPDVLGHGPVVVPGDELFGEGTEAVVDDDRLAVLVEILRAVADRGRAEAVAGAVECHGEVDAGGVAHRGRSLGPIGPGRSRRRHFDAGLVEQRLVGEATGGGELIDDVVDSLVVRAVHPRPGKALAVARLDGVGVRDIGPDVEHVLGEAAEIGDAAEVGTFADRELDRQALEHRLVRHDVDDDGDARVLGLEGLELLGPGIAFDAILIAGEAQLLRGGRQRAEERHGGGGGKGQSDGHFILPDVYGTSGCAGSFWR
jgi:hypothetical protein